MGLPAMTCGDGAAIKLHATGGAGAPASGEFDEARACARVARLFARAVDRATGGASACVDGATAARLVSSIEAVLACGGFPETEPDPDAAFERGRARFSDAMRSCETLWRAVCTTMPPELRNVSLRDTLASIEGCWLRHDPRLYADEVPCAVDYQLCCPVEKRLPSEGEPPPGGEPPSEEESPVGPFYLREYLRRLLVEARLLARFDPCDEIAVLEASCPDWRGLHVNLYEPVAACVLGRELLGEAAGRSETGASARLAMTREDQDALATLVDAVCSGEKARTVRRASVLRVPLWEATHGAAARLGLARDEAAYLATYAGDLAARLAVGGVRGVFPVSA